VGVHPKWNEPNIAFYARHFIVVNGIDGITYHIIDPYYHEKERLSDYGHMFVTRGYFSPGPPPQPRKSKSKRAPAKAILSVEDYFTTPTSDYSSLVVSLGGSAPSVMLISPSGERVGLDADGVTTAVLHEEIPGSVVFLDAIENQVGAGLPPEPPDSWHCYLSVPAPEEGEWRVEIRGLTGETAPLLIESFAWDGSLHPPLEREVQVPPGEILVIPYTFSADPSPPANSAWAVR